MDSAWAMTDLYDPSNPTHVKVKGEIEVNYCSIKIFDKTKIFMATLKFLWFQNILPLQYGSGIHQLRTVKEILEGLKEAGLELISFRNCHHEGDKPW